MLDHVQRYRKEIATITSSKNKLLLVIGPCSAWPIHAVVEYARRLAKLKDRYEDRIYFVMRCYTQKPRTSLGWKGTLVQPNPNEKEDISKGVEVIKELYSEITAIGLPIADEAVFISLMPQVEDWISYVAIGARSVEDQEHRIYASYFPGPVGMKNPTSGNLDILKNALTAAKHPHVMWRDKQVPTPGNPNAHAILRGSQDGPNYFQLQTARNVLGSPVLIDCSHGNSLKDGMKDPQHQFDVMRETIQYRPLGYMVESYLVHGKQTMHKLNDGCSITDACLGWDETEAFVKELYELCNTT